MPFGLKNAFWLEESPICFSVVYEQYAGMASIAAAYW